MYYLGKAVFVRLKISSKFPQNKSNLESTKVKIKCQKFYCNYVHMHMLNFHSACQIINLNCATLHCKSNSVHSMLNNHAHANATIRS